MAILEVENSSGKPWVGCHVIVNNIYSLVVPQSGKIDLTKYGSKVSLKVNGVILRINDSMSLILERDSIIVARYCVRKGSFSVQERTLKKVGTILEQSPIKSQNTPLLHV